MIKIIREKDCCGCGACNVICPKECINMEEKTLGHLFPIVDENRCIGCNRCEEVCPMLQDESNEEYEKELYAAYSKDDEIRYLGSSGGMFGTFATRLISKGWIVYGAAFNENFKLKCTAAKTLTELKPLMKSKYLQSDLSDKYIEIQNYLKNGKKVLFVSTPCQVAALKSFLKRDYESLITIDFFCKGVPSQKFFDQCKDYDEKKKKIEILDFSFRTKKRNGSTPHYYSLKFKKNDKIKFVSKLYFNSSFYAAFQKYINLRESCYHCRFAGLKRMSDITIGDFHDIDRYVKEINRFKGISMVVINTKKGKKLWEFCCNDLNTWEMDFNELIKNKSCFTGSIGKPNERELFIKDYQNNTFDSLANKYMNPKKYWKNNLYYTMPQKLRNIIKKGMGV